MHEADALEELLRFHHPKGLAEAAGLTEDQFADKVVALGVDRLVSIPNFGPQIDAARERAG